MIPLFRNSITTQKIATFPLSLIPDVLFRFDAKNTSAFVLRTDILGNDWVKSYTDPISGITINQPTASLQPKRLPAGKVIFNANLLMNNSINLNAQSVAACFGTIQLPLTYPNNGDDTYCFTDSQKIGIYGSVGTSNLRTDLLQNIKINNIASTILQNNCTVYGERVLPATSSTYLLVGSQGEFPIGQPYRYVIAEIYDIIYFNRVLTATEQTDLHNYYVAYHNL
jgi:hypothetical protein